MANLTPFELFRIRLTGVLFAVVYFTADRNFLGARLSSWLKWAIFIFTVTAWFMRLPVYWVIVGAVLFVVAQFLYWYVKRLGYILFLPARDQSDHVVGGSLEDNRKVKVEATGIFSVSHRQAYVLQKPGAYWRVPVGDHAIMVEHVPGKYLYQFVQAGALRSVDVGFLIFGRRPQEALAVRFLSSWGPEFGQNTPKQLMAGANHTPAKLERTIYLTFAEKESLGLVRKNLLRDANKPLHKPIES